MYLTGQYCIRSQYHHHQSFLGYRAEYTNRQSISSSNRFASQESLGQHQDKLLSQCAQHIEHIELSTSVNNATQGLQSSLRGFRPSLDNTALVETGILRMVKHTIQKMLVLAKPR